MKRKKRIPLLLAALLLGSLLSACQSPTAPAEPSPTAAEQQSSPAPSDPVTEEVRKLILDELTATEIGQRTYLATEDVGPAQMGDWRIDAITYVGETATGETTGVGFQIDSSSYSIWEEGETEASWRQDDTPNLVVLGRRADGSYEGVRGFLFGDEWQDNLPQRITEVTYSLYDLDYALWRDGWDIPIGLGSDVNVFSEDRDGAPEVKQLENWEPSYADGDSWSEIRWPDCKAICYHDGKGKTKIQTLVVTRSDLHTAQGVRVGSTRAEVLRAHPNPSSIACPYEGGPDFPSSDYLWYCPSDEGYGTGMIFFFDGDVVCEILLCNFMD